jgi:hypothetical protein
MIDWSQIQNEPIDHGHHSNNHCYEISCEDKDKDKSTEMITHNIEITGECNEISIAQFPQD